MHALQPKHTKLKSEEIQKLLQEYNISLSQLPKMKHTDTALPTGCVIGDVVKIERMLDDKPLIYFRVVVE